MTRTLVFKKERCTVCFEVNKQDPSVAISFDIADPTNYHVVTLRNDDDEWDYFLWGSQYCYINEADTVILTPDGMVFEINGREHINEQPKPYW